MVPSCTSRCYLATMIAIVVASLVFYATFETECRGADRACPETEPPQPALPPPQTPPRECGACTAAPRRWWPGPGSPRGTVPMRDGRPAATTFPAGTTRLARDDMLDSLDLVAADASRHYSRLPAALRQPIQVSASADFLLVGELHSVSEWRSTAMCEGSAIELARRTVLRSKAMSEECVFYDVGANMGSYGLMAGRLGCDRVVAVEPQRHIAGLLSMSAAINGFSGRFRVVNRAVTNVTGDTVEMRAAADDVSAAGDAVVHPGALAGATDCAETSRIDDLPDSATVASVAFLKIDVEGFDVAALASASGLFARRAVSNVVAEWGPRTRWTNAARTTVQDALDVLAAMDRFGFELCALPYCMSGCELYDPRRAVFAAGGTVRCTPYPRGYPDRGTLLTSQADDCMLWWSLPAFWNASIPNE